MSKKPRPKENLDLYAYAVCESAADLIDPAVQAEASAESRTRIAAMLRQIAKRLEPESKAVLEEFTAAVIYGALCELMPTKKKKVIRGAVADLIGYKAQSVANAATKCAPGVKWWLSDEHLTQYLAESGCRASSRSEKLRHLLHSLNASKLLAS